MLKTLYYITLIDLQFTQIVDDEILNTVINNYFSTAC